MRREGIEKVARPRDVSIQVVLSSVAFPQSIKLQLMHVL